MAKGAKIMLISRIFGIAVAVTLLAASIAEAQSPTHVALIIGNSNYATGQLATARANADVMAETMRAAGYDVTEVNDVTQADIGGAMRDFLDKVAAGGPDTVAFFYYSGLAAQASNENFLVPVDAQIGGIDDVPLQALRLNDLTDALAALPVAARIVVLDASRDTGYGRGTPGLVAPGLAIMQVPTGSLVGFAAAPDQIAVQADSQYDLYTAALVSLMRQPGLDLNQIFEATRAQVNQLTRGYQTPWTAMGLTVQVTLFPEQPGAAAVSVGAAVPPPPGIAAGALTNAPPPATIPPKGERVVTKGMLSQLSPDQAYTVAIEEDSLDVYQWFVELFPQYQYAGQIWDIINSRRDELLWQRAVAVNSRNAYWNYLDRFPNGIHAGEAQQALASMNESRRPPRTYVPQPVQLPPDYSDEAMGLPEIVQQGLVAPPPVFGDFPPDYAAAPPELPPIDLSSIISTLQSFAVPPSPPEVDNPPPPGPMPPPGPPGPPGPHGPPGPPGPHGPPGPPPGPPGPPHHRSGVMPPNDHRPPPPPSGPKNAGMKKPTPTDKTPKIPSSAGPHGAPPPTPGAHPGAPIAPTPGAHPGAPTIPSAPTPGAHPGAPTIPSAPTPGAHPGAPTIPSAPTPGAHPGAPTIPSAPTPGAHPGGPTLPPPPATPGVHPVTPTMPPAPSTGTRPPGPGLPPPSQRGPTPQPTTPKQLPQQVHRPAPTPQVHRPTPQVHRPAPQAHRPAPQVHRPAPQVHRPAPTPHMAPPRSMPMQRRK